MAEVENVSYPTLKKRVTALIDALTSLREDDRLEAERLLLEVQAKRLAPETASRLMRELAGGL